MDDDDTTEDEMARLPDNTDVQAQFETAIAAETALSQDERDQLKAGLLETAHDVTDLDLTFLDPATPEDRVTAASVEQNSLRGGADGDRSLSPLIVSSDLDNPTVGPRNAIEIDARIQDPDRLIAATAAVSAALTNETLDARAAEPEPAPATP